MASPIHIPAKKPHRERTRRASELFTFIATTGLIFAVTFTALNVSAFAQQARHWLGIDAEATALASTLLLPEQTDAGEEPLTAATGNVTTTPLPELALEITPPADFIFIPRLGIRAPVLPAAGVEYLGDWTYIEQQIQATLQNGVVHFPGTADPGSRGNAFLTGHSSYYPWDAGRYKDIFALLPKVVVGDDIVIYHDQEKYIYRVSETREVSPKDVDVLQPTDDYRLTLMTCTPVGTALRRLIVTAQLVEEPAQIAMSE